MTPVLVVSVDTEEEFDWHAPFSSSNRSVRHAADLPRLHEVFEECGVRPSYLVDHPVTTTDKSVRVLDEFRRRGSCEIGAHLHPWVNPPLREEVNRVNSYLCNLPAELQREKLVALTDEVRKSFGVAPVSFKAGRYGLDFALAPTLRQLGYRVDASVRALEDFTPDGGPNFFDFGPAPFWIEGRNGLLEVPCSVAFNRRPFRLWAKIHRTLSGLQRGLFRPVGLLWHLRLLRRVTLTPEGQQTTDLIRVAKALAREPFPLLHLSLHSPSAGVGYTPYVRTADERQRFLQTLRDTLRFIMGPLGAKNLTLGECPDEFRPELFSRAGRDL